MNQGVRQIVQNANQHMRDVMEPTMHAMRQGNVPTEEEQIDEYRAVRGDPHKTAAVVVGKMKNYEQVTGRKLGIDPLQAARQWEQAMERLMAARR